MDLEQELNALHDITVNAKNNRVFSYVVLILGSLVAVIVGLELWGLISSLSDSMQSISNDIKLMREDMSVIAERINTMDNSMLHMSEDIHYMRSDLEAMSIGVQNMDVSTEKMSHDMKDFNKLNPVNLF